MANINNGKKEPRKKVEIKASLKDISDLKELPALPFIPESTSKSIADFLRKQNEGLIEYPSNQRGNVWSVKDQSELIESLIRGIPIPPIYMNTIKKKVENEDGEIIEKEVWEILDGRQRTTAIFDFFEKSIVSINKNLPKGYENLEKYKFKDIEKANPFFAGKFTELRLPVVCMTNAPSQLKTEFFQKLNKGGKALTTGELAHSTLEPANGFMVQLMSTSFYQNNVKTTDRFGQYVPISKIMHFILMSMNETEGTFIYQPRRPKNWEDNVCSNNITIQTDLDNLHEERYKKHIPLIKAEVDRVCGLINEILGDVEINSSNNNLVLNILTSLLVLEDKSHPRHMNHESLKKSFKELIHCWNQGHETRITNKIKTNLANITPEEERIIIECNRLNSISKSNRKIVLENIAGNAYENI